MEKSSNTFHGTSNWQSCHYCPKLHFNTCGDFQRHIREKHALKEGSFVLCRYGQNGLCPSLQFGDLSLAGYQHHVKKHHISSEDSSTSWDFYSSSQNLPAVLNDPHRGKQTSFFTKIWGESFVDKSDIPPSPYLPEISLSHFASYSKKIFKRYRRHCRLLNDKPEQPTLEAKHIEIPCEIPPIFYQPNLPLSKADVFGKVFPILNGSSNVMSSARELQEKLSLYLDAIEMKISKQVALKSDAFFHAMLSHDTIMEQMETAVKLVKKTRENIGKTKSGLTVGPIRLVNLTLSRRNMDSVYEQLKMMSTVQQTQPMIQLLLSTSDYVGALDLISTTQKVLSDQLSGIHAFRHLSPQLTEMERLIDKMLVSEFQRYSVSDLNRPLTDETDLPIKDNLVPVISGLLRLKQFEFIDTYKSEAETSIQTMVKEAMIDIISDREENIDFVLRGSQTDIVLTLIEAIQFLKCVMPLLLVILKRSMTVNDLILEISQMEDLTMQNEEFFTDEEHDKIQEKLKKMMRTLCDYCNERCTIFYHNIILPKTDTVTTGKQLASISQQIDKFIAECQSITGYRNSTLKLSLKSFAMKHVENFNIERRNKLRHSLENERWKISPVNEDIQNLVNEITVSSIIPESLIESRSEAKTNKYLIINNEQFAVVATVLELIQIAYEYCQCASQLPSVVQYVEHCLLDLMKFFNSRCYQLVLRAGALQSAGLKTITTTNLALVSRSLQVVLWLIPYIKQHLQQFEEGQNTSNGFDNLTKDIESHKTEIENKIYLIVGNLLNSQLVDWDARPPVPSQTFRNISKHLVKLHEALTNILPLSEIRTIYRIVHLNFKDKLREQLCRMNIVANGSPQHGVVTSELTFYLQTLRTLQVISDNDLDDSFLYDIWTKC